MEEVFGFPLFFIFATIQSFFKNRPVSLATRLLEESGYFFCIRAFVLKTFFGFKANMTSLKCFNKNP